MNKLLNIGKIFLMFFVLCLLWGCQESGKIDPSYDDPPGNITFSPESTATPVPSATQNPEGIVYFTDINLEMAVRDVLHKSSGPIITDDVENITELSLRVKGIYCIDGLEYFTGLETLDLYGNRVNDLRPLRNLTNLKSLNISDNFNIIYGGEEDKGMNLGPLAGLEQLEHLWASENMIKDVSALSGLINLKTLVLSHNRIDDISSLLGCTKMEHIDLSYNYGTVGYMAERGISDVKCFRQMHQLKYVDISYNIVTSIDSLQDKQQLVYLNFSSNKISNMSCLAGSTSLEYLNCSNNRISDHGPADEIPGLITFIK